MLFRIIQRKNKTSTMSKVFVAGAQEESDTPKHLMGKDGVLED
jgi:hypothetical protein